MTREEFDKIEWKGMSHLAFNSCHYTLYKSNTQFFSIFKQVSVPFRNGQPTKRRIVDYMFNGKWYDGINKLLEAINKTK